MGGSLQVVNASRADPACVRRDTDEVDATCQTHFDEIAQAFSFNKGDVLLFTRWTFHRTQPWKKCRPQEVDCASGGARHALVGRFTSGNATFAGYVPGGSTQKKHTW